MDEQHWIATWGTAQQLARPVEPGGGPRMPDEDLSAPGAPAKLGDQTVRMKARATAGGTAVRVALSNSFGQRPVRIGAARLDGHRLTFGGREAVELPTGAQISSDPLDHPVAPQTDLVVSLYLPDHDVTPTTHETGLRTAWLAPGDQTAAPSLENAVEFQSYLWLTGIDVLTTRAAATVVALGDSITDGTGTTPGTDRPWPSVLARRLAAGPDRPPRAVVNMGIAGNRVLRETDGLGVSALARFDRDVLGRPGVRWLIVAEGLNDILFSELPGRPDSERATAGDIIAGYRMLIGRAHAHGLRVIGCTLIPMGHADIFTPEMEQTRVAVNRWIRDSTDFDAVADLDAATRDPSAPTRLRPDWISDDDAHPDDAGHRAIAEAFDLDLFRA